MWVGIELRKCERCKERPPEARLKYTQENGHVTLGDGSYCIACAQEVAHGFNERLGNHGSNLQMIEKERAALRKYLSEECDRASAALDKAAPGNDQNYWGARLRQAQEIAQKMDAGDFRK